jgi:hypothetical protein
MTDKPKWKRYEELVGSIQAALAPDAEVKTDEQIPGKSGSSRQIDVSIRKKVGQFPLLIVMDCKDWSDPVDIKGVEEFAGLVEDVEANKGAMVCNRGFTEGAKNRAHQKGIDLFRAVDIGNVDWPAYATLPTVCDFRAMKRFSVKFRGKAHSQPDLGNAPLLLPTYEESGQVVDTVGNLVIRAWNDGALVYSPGAHSDLPIRDSLFMRIGGDEYGPVSISADIVVEQKLFFGHWPLSAGQGFQNDVTGTFVTTGFTTDQLDAGVVERTWQRIDDICDLSVRPAIVLLANDHYPVALFEAGKDDKQEDI